MHRKVEIILFIINNLLSLLEKNGLKQADLCEAIGISSSTMTNWKNRGTDPPSKHIIPICEFLNISPYILLTGKEKSSQTVELTADEQEKIKSVDAKEQRLLNAFRSLPLEEQFCFIGKMEQAAENYNSAENVG